MKYRFYSFVAGLYLSPLQRGLQTAHAVSEMHADLLLDDSEALSSSVLDRSIERNRFNAWASNDKTIVILDALNSAGVIEAYNKMVYFGKEFDLPITIFHEDADSLNGAPTAAGIIVPDYIFDTRKIAKPVGFWKSLFSKESVQSVYRYEEKDENGTVRSSIDYVPNYIMYQFCDFIKSYRLAQS
jgi:hypothetical protein